MWAAASLVSIRISITHPVTAIALPCPINSDEFVCNGFVEDEDDLDTTFCLKMGSEG